MDKDNISHAIKDPVHGTMQFTTVENHWLKPFIDSPHFQRLRHIKQMGMGDSIFPGAVHTRFNHSLGCCYIASQICQKIGLADEERQLAMIACLLHDIGHGPFSHTFEDLFVHKLIRHETWTPFFLADYNNASFFTDYQKNNPRHYFTEEKFLRIEEMIMHKKTASRLLADIVSSQLDADRLDYLLRDSHFCGVSYGEFDLSWMLNSMIIVNSAQGERLGLTHKGIGIAEHYLMARRLMIRNIYLHSKKLAIEFYLIKLLAALAEDIQHYPLFREFKSTRMGLFLSKVNDFNQKIINKIDSHSAIQHFCEENYSIYKELCDYDVYFLIKRLSTMDDNHYAVKIAKRIQFRVMPKIIRLDYMDMNRIEKNLIEFKKAHKNIEDWQIAIIKTPHRSYHVEEDPILIVNEHGIVKPLNETSLMIQAMGNQLEHTAFLCIDKMIFDTAVIKDFLHEMT